jgi:N-methylhydantoinase A/oxoprolinase/acetone carboxylase beta subunit
MKYAIGIDTGGTYTDAVVYDFESRRIASSAKALTTRDDLSTGILQALDGLDGALTAEAGMVSLSTTLATNACVEGKGGRAKLLFIGVDRKTVEWVGPEAGLTDPDKIYCLDARTTMDGRVIQAPDWAAFMRESETWFQDADALAIVALNASSTGAVLEKEARRVIAERYSLPVICGYELFPDLNAIRRGASALLNGRLIPVLAEFLGAIRRALQERGLDIPVCIVRSDASLMSERFTGARPVETILCGPAASVVGGNALVGADNAVIVDMGGTTTDIALIRDGEAVKANDGIHIGAWHTFVKGVYVETLGLGGDSAVRHDRDGVLRLESARVVPLATAAARWPQITRQLALLLERQDRHFFPLHEFFVAVRPIGDSARYADHEKRFCAALQSGPLIWEEAARAVGRSPYEMDVKRLEREGVILRIGLTPTDVMHLKGDFNAFDPEASRLGAEFVAASAGLDVSALCDRVYDTVKRRLYRRVAGILMKENMPALHKQGIGGELTAFLNRAWEMARGENARRVKFSLETDSVLIGVGAPIHIFLPDVARALGTRCEIPELAGVANALGAVAGNVVAQCTISIRPAASGFLVYGPAGSHPVQSLEEAAQIAQNLAKEEARAEALRRGAADDMIISLKENPMVLGTGYGGDIFVESAVIATAIGKIDL